MNEFEERNLMKDFDGQRVEKMNLRSETLNVELGGVMLED